MGTSAEKNPKIAQFLGYRLGCLCFMSGTEGLEDENTKSDAAKSPMDRNSSFQVSLSKDVKASNGKHESCTS